MSTARNWSRERVVTYQGEDEYGNPFDQYLKVEEYSHYVSSRNSPRSNGKLKMVANPYNKSLLRVNSEPDVYRYGKKVTARAIAPLGRNQFLIGYDDARRKAVERWYGRAQALQANLMDLYRTRKETADMIGSRIQQLLRAAKCARRGDARGAAKALQLHNFRKFKKKEISGRWLELQYGWLPLLSDIHAMAMDYDPPSGWVRTRGFSDVEFTMKSKFGWGWDHANLRNQHVCTIAAYLTVDSSAVRSLSKWGVDNPALTLWEAVPWSFVVDWFIPVGSYLESLTALNGIRVSEASETRRTKHKSYTRYDNTDQPQNICLSKGITVVDDFYMNRTLGLPDFPLPQLENPFSVGRALNAIALLRQTLGRK